MVILILYNELYDSQEYKIEFYGILLTNINKYVII
nr:MAG TPA: hypothetical protein [Caudoviricetes sp.]